MSLTQRLYANVTWHQPTNSRTATSETTNMDRNVILSFGIDRERLADREAALRQAGFEVISVSSEMQAHFEIEMGRCGLLLMCYRTSPLTACELTTVFRKHSPNGRIIYVMNSAGEPFLSPPT